jgi:hypothetical protein
MRGTTEPLTPSLSKGSGASWFKGATHERTLEERETE